MDLPVFFTSVFVDDNFPFSGNALATFIDFEKNSKLDNETMLSLAREINFSETTFLLPPLSSMSIASVKIFTPTEEIPFAGHPTLGSSFVLKETGKISQMADDFTLDLKIGSIKVIRNKNYFSMIQPHPVFLQKYADIPALASLLSLDKKDFSKYSTPQYVSTGLPYLLIQLNSLQAVKDVQLDTTILNKKLYEYPSKDIVVFCTESVNSKNNIHVRMFAPFAGINEDPATGSAIGPLSAYIEENNLLKDKKRGDELVFEQGYWINRPCKLFAQVIYEKGIIVNIKVSGKVKKLLEGHYYLEY